jgi:hypothetical protein
MVYKRVDSNQSELVKQIRKLGATVQHLHAVGKGCPDVLVGYKDNNYLFEIKDGDKKKLTSDQVIWHRDWKGQVRVITNIEDVIATFNKISDIV